MMFNLLIALFLPWAAGAAMLGAARQFTPTPSHPGRRLRLAGYGFFLGQALLYITIKTTSGNGVSPDSVMGLMTMIALAGVGAWAFLARRNVVTTGHAAAPPGHLARPSTTAEKWLIALLLAWITIHVIFAVIDVLSIPVYPWDAWLVWMYRAKAWFYSAGLPDIVPPGRWFAAQAVPPYTIEAFGYPDFLSVNAAWLAMMLGTWSETWVNIPGLICAGAIGLALLGQLQRLDLRPAAAVTLVYFLFSVPLFGAHMSLGGYADIWMAGFAGLGFLALLAGLPQREKSYIVLGLALLVFSSLVKNEGAVWFVLGIALVILFTVPARVQWVGAGVLVALAAIAGAAGFTYFEFPGLGTAGLQDGRLHIPLIGQFVLQTYDVLPAYARNAFLLGSWHVLWALLLGVLLTGLHRNGSRERAVATGFLLLFLASQAFIFGLTNQGEWARQYTAINRLPMHFLPAMLFVTAVAMTRIRLNIEPTSRRQAWGALMASLMVTALLTTAWMYRTSTHGIDPIEPELQFVMGAGNKGAEGIQVNAYQQGFALLSSGPVDIAADDYHYVDLSMDSTEFGDPESAPAFFWRPSNNPGAVERATLTENGLTRLHDRAGWDERISEYGLLVPESEAANPVLRRLALEPASMGNRWQQTWRGWIAFEPWSLRSVNFLWGGAERQDLPLLPLVLTWALVALLLLWLIGRKSGNTWKGHVFVVVLLAWLVLDVRWTVNGFRQAAHSVENGLFLSTEDRQSAGDDRAILELVQRFQAGDHQEAPVRVLVVGDRADFGYYLERAKYHLLPHSAHVVPRLADRFRQVRVDYVLFVDDFSADSTWSAIWGRLPMDNDWRDDLELADSNSRAILFRVEP